MSKVSKINIFANYLINLLRYHFLPPATPVLGRQNMINYSDKIEHHFIYKKASKGRQYDIKTVGKTKINSDKIKWLNKQVEGVGESNENKAKVIVEGKVVVWVGQKKNVFKCLYE